MAKRSRQEYLMISLEKGVELYLATMATEGKSPRYIGWLKTRLRFFQDHIRKTQGEGYSIQDLTLENGRGFIRALMAREKIYTNPEECKNLIRIDVLRIYRKINPSFNPWEDEALFCRRLQMRSVWISSRNSTWMIFCTIWDGKQHGPWPLKAE